MRLDLQYRIGQDEKQRTFLMENSYWYKYLNRSDKYYKDLLSEYKKDKRNEKTNKVNDTLSTLDTVNTIFKMLK